jgi:hypothetical protein
MSRDRLPQLLDALRAELARGAPPDPATREEILALARALERVAEQPPGARVADEGIRERLEAQVQRFEASHPELARALANLIDVLALFGL